MAAADITKYNDGAFGNPGDDFYVVASGTTASINPGEPVTKALGGVAVSAMATNKPVAGTDFLAGVSTSTSTETASLAGSVTVEKFTPGTTYLIAPKVAATFATQAAYNALVGSRVLLDLTGGVYTILAADSATNGCVIMPLDIAIYPGRIRFAFRNAVNYLA